MPRLLEKSVADSRCVVRSEPLAAMHRVAERLAVIIDGKIEQDGPAAEVFAKPATRFIRRLLTPFDDERDADR